MTTKATSIRSMGGAARFSEAIEKLRQPGDYVAVVRGVARAIVMSCPDGCGDTLTVNLDGRAGPAWRMYYKDNRLTVYPSVWRETGCKAHFIIWNDRILWCGPSESAWNLPKNDQLANLILTRLSFDRFQHYEEIAQAVNAIPWEVSWVCDDLVAEGRAIRGKKGTFKKSVSPSGGGGLRRINVRV